MNYSNLYIIAAVIFMRQVDSMMKSTQCSGEIFSLTCGNDNYVIHVIYESYFYFPEDECTYNPSHCSGAEIEAPVSAEKCNGYSQCFFQVPSDHILPICDNQNASSITVFYDCISKYQIINACSPYNSRNHETVYLTSPKYPHDQIEPIKCFCNISGQNISAEVYEHKKSNDSQVVLMFVTNKLVLNVNDVEIRNKILFDGMDTIHMVLDNRYRTELFKLWMKFKGKNLNIVCTNHPVEILMSTHQNILYSSQIKQTTFHQSTKHVYPMTTIHQISTFNQSTENVYQRISALHPSKETLHQMTQFYTTADKESQNGSHLAPALSSHLQSVDSSVWSAQQITLSLYSTSMYSTRVDLLSTSFMNQTDPVPNSMSLESVTPSTSYILFSSIKDLELDRDNTDEQAEQDTDLRVIIVTICVFTLIIIICVSLGIFTYRRKKRQWEERYNIDRDVYHAYNFSFDKN